MLVCVCVPVCARVCVFMTKIVNYVNWPRPTELVIVGVPVGERVAEREWERGGTEG